MRELSNLIERELILRQGKSSQDALFAELDLPAAGGPRPSPAGDAPLASLDEAMAAHIRLALERSQGRIHGPRGAAALLGINPSTLRSRMLKLGIGTNRVASGLPDDSLRV